MQMKTMAVWLAGATLCAAGSAARAQATEPVQKPTTIKLGVFLPTNANLKNGIGKTWFSAGADYAFNKQGAGQGLMPLAYVDYAGKSSSGVTVNYVGIGPGVRYYTSPPGTSSLTPYLGAGVGAYFIHATTISNKTRVGFKVNAGLEFNQSYLLEVNYTNAGSVVGTRVDGINVQAGLRF